MELFQITTDFDKKYTCTESNDYQMDELLHSHSINAAQAVKSNNARGVEVRKI